MRLVTTILPMALLAACQGPEIELSHMSTLQEATNGVVVYDDGQKVHAAMRGTTCAFDTLNGWFIADHDLPTENERIVDTLNGEVLGASAEGAHLLDRGRDVAIPKLREARLWDGGLVTLHRADGGCVAGWEGEPEVVVPSAACDASAAVSVDPSEGVLYVGTPDGTLQIDRQGAASFEEAADLSAFDVTTGLLYLAMKGEPHVWATSADGGLAWHTELPGAVTSLDDMGRRGMVLVMMRDPEGGGRFVVLDGETGERHVEHDAPSSEVEVTVSEDGTTVAVTLQEEAVYFYDVTEEGETPKKRETLGSPPAPTFAD